MWFIAIYVKTNLTLFVTLYYGIINGVPKFLGSYLGFSIHPTGSASRRLGSCSPPYACYPIFATNIFASSPENAAYARFSEEEMKLQHVRIQGEKVLSGALTNAPPEMVDFDNSWVKKNLVSEEEALEGPDTFMGRPVFYDSTAESGARTFSYGMVIDSEWIPACNSRVSTSCPIPRRR